MKIIPRFASREILDASSEFPAVLVTGARQVGKTTLLRETVEAGRRFVSLDALPVRDLARRDPDAFLKAYPAPVIIDEIQYAPQLLPHIKAIIDENPNLCGRFWLSGSQQFHLMKNVSESLAGRIAIINLGGIAQREEKGCADARPFSAANVPLGQTCDGIVDIYERIHRGSFPALVSGRIKNRQRFYDSYVRTYIERDVHDLARVSDENRFFTFLRAAAARTGQLLNLSELARDIGISMPTAKDWMGVLEASNIVWLLRPYSRNVTSRIVKTPKLYFLDTGLCSHLLGWDSATTLMNGAMSGAMLETFVVGEILKSFWNSGRTPRIFFYRDRMGVEIDLLIEANGVLEPIEVKRNTNPTPSDVKAFGKVAGLGFELGRGAVVCPAERALPLMDGVVVFPAGAL